MSTSNFDPEKRFRKRTGGPERGFKKHDDGVYWSTAYGGYTRQEKEPGTYCNGVLERLYVRRRNEKDKWQFYPIGDRCTKCGEIMLDEDREREG